MNTPCTKRCAFTAGAPCEGCGRSLEEVRSWKKLTPFRRTAIARELPARMRKLARCGSSGRQ